MQIKLDFQFAASFKVGNLLRAGAGGFSHPFSYLKKKKKKLGGKVKL